MYATMLTPVNVNVQYSIVAKFDGLSVLGSRLLALSWRVVNIILGGWAIA